MRNNLPKFIFIVALVTIIGAAFGSTVSAVSSSQTYTGVLELSDPHFDGPACGGIGPYDVVGPVSPNVTDTYTFTSDWVPMPLVVTVYKGNFDSTDPFANVVKDLYWTDTVDLDMTEVYYLVIQRNCAGVTPTDYGNWSFDISGLGSLSASVISTPIVTAAVIAPDARLNWRVGDIEAVLYRGSDADGDPTMQAYCINSDAAGYLGLVVSQSDLPQEAPATNTLIKNSDACNIEFWALAAGSEYKYQINIGPNSDGTVTELLFNDLNAADLTKRTLNLYQLGD
jgi:hypothetical protein